MSSSGKIISKLFRGTVASIILATVAAMIGIVIMLMVMRKKEGYKDV